MLQRKGTREIREKPQQEACQAHGQEKESIVMPRTLLLATHLTPASQRNIHEPKTQGFWVLGRVYRKALHSWHFRWQISVTTKGYTVNTRWQVLKLACFHNCRFRRGEGPFSGTVKKNSRLQPATIPTLPPTIPCYENVIILFWKSWGSCVSFVITMFLERDKGENITKAKIRKPFMDQFHHAHQRNKKDWG